MIEVICFVGDCRKVIINGLNGGITKRITRSCKNGKLIITRRNSELKRILKEKGPNACPKKVEKKYGTISVKTEEAKNLEQAQKIMEKSSISPEKFLVVKIKEDQKKKNSFYSFLKNLGWVVTLPDSSEKYLQEFVATFFLNFEEEKKRKLKDLLA